MARYPLFSRPALLLVFMTLVIPCAHCGAESFSSPSALVSNKMGTKVFVAESGSSQIAIVDTTTGAVEGHIQLPQSPTGLVPGMDETQLYVTGGGHEGTLMTVDLEKGQVLDSLQVGHTPLAPVLSPDGEWLYLCNRFDNCVAIVNLKQKSVESRIPVKREPVACGLASDGKLLFVANHLPVGTAHENDIAAEVEVIDTASRGAVKSIRLPNGSTGLRGLCVSPDGKHVYVTHILGRYTMPTTQLERGWMNTNALSVIDAGAMTLVNTVLLDDITGGAANPWGVIGSPDGKHLFVTHAGTHEISIIDQKGLLDKLAQVAQGTLEKNPVKVEDVPNTLSFLGPLRKRAGLQVIGPRSCTLAGTNLVIAGYFSDHLEVINPADDRANQGRLISLMENSVLTDSRRGEMLFNDARLCFQKWQSCASCHPEGRADGLNWDLMNDGLGNSKSTKSLLLSHATPPVMVTGIRPNAEAAVRSGIKYIQFTTPNEEDAKAIDLYLKGMRPVERPAVDRETIHQGKIIFEKAECAKCHSGEHLTNMNKYNVGTGAGSQADTEFDTPTLVEVWRTAPYLYDGRAATLEDVLGKFNPDDRHGKTSHLTFEERRNLLAYLLSL